MLQALEGDEGVTEKLEWNNEIGIINQESKRIWRNIIYGYVGIFYTASGKVNQREDGSGSSTDTWSLPSASNVYAIGRKL